MAGLFGARKLFFALKTAAKDIPRYFREFEDI
jgi:hypothetical protein